MAVGLVASLLPASLALGGTTTAAASTSAVSPSASVSVASASQAAEQAERRRQPKRKRFWKWIAADNFQNLNRNRWSTFSGTPGCCPDAQWDASMVKVRNGRLQLHTAPRNGRWLSGGVGAWDWDRATRRYGRWDARIRFDPGTGVSAAALLWPTDNGWPPELDFYEIFETWGGRQQMSVTTHWQQRGQHQASRRVVRRDFTRWHTASVRWGPNRIVYYLDNRVIKVERGGSRIPKSKMWLGFQTHAHRINGRYARLPQGRSSVKLEVDWVRVYRRNR